MILGYQCVCDALSLNYRRLMGAKATKLGHVLCSTVMSQNSLAAIELFLLTQIVVTLFILYSSNKS